MYASVTSTALVGVEPTEVSVEAHVGRGKQQYFVLVGLPDTAVREARERVLSAITSASFSTPTASVTVNLSPADIPKAGSAYDLPIALGVLAASGEIDVDATRVVALGELALDGSVRSARGGLGAALVAKRLNLPCLLPPASSAEASVVGGVDVRSVTSLAQAVSAAMGGPAARPASPGRPDAPATDLRLVKGQALARRALEIAAAGGHHLLMAGPPGAGKTLLARCLPGILPRLQESEALEVAQIWSAAGVTRSGFDTAPFRSPHHTATVAAMVGGGSGMPSPGEVTLAHRGVLFLDELGEFPPRLMESLRQPLEDGSVTIARRGISVEFPSRFQMVAATNPCPCGFQGDAKAGCNCTPVQVDRYRTRFSGPLLDRFDLRVMVGRVAVEELSGRGSEPSRDVAARVATARAAQWERATLNRELSGEQLERMPMDARAKGLLASAAERSAVTARGWDRLRRVARTIADLGSTESIEEEHMAEALALRGDV